MKYFIVAGEASGDLHASHLMNKIKAKDSQAEFVFFGGDLMQAEGGTLLKHYRELAFMGIVAVLKNIRTILKNMQFCKKSILDFHPDVLILVDYPGFNLKIAKYIHLHTSIPVYYYISPKIWVWKEYRIKSIKKYVDKMLTIFPFETEFYQKHHYQVDYVGNPSLDGIDQYLKEKNPVDDFRKKNRLSDKKIIALLPGSRMQEISACLPMMLNVASKYKDYQIVIAGAPGIEAHVYTDLGVGSNIPVVFDQTFTLVENAYTAIVNSGTATLETALLKAPQVVVYYTMLGKFAYYIKKVLLKTEFISLVNIIAGRELVRELYAHFLTEENLKNELELLLFNAGHRKSILQGYEEISMKLGKPGAADNCADKIVKSLQLR